METWLIFLLLFPVICAVIGYVTNVLAVKMIFRPHHRAMILGVPVQGVLPKHQRHFARMLARIVVKQFMTTRDLVRNLDKPEVYDELEKQVARYAGTLVDELKASVPADKQALLNPAMVQMAQEQIVAEARKRGPELIQALAQRADEKLKLEDVITEKVMGLGPDGLERIIYAVSKKELDFIEYYGGIFGFVLGVFQWVVLQFMGNVALPIVGALVGTVTNWLAIQMLFYPREETVYLGFFKYQGLFPKRQHEMATKMGEIASRELIIPREIFNELCEQLLPEALTAEHLAEFEELARKESPQLFQLVDSRVPESERPALRERLAKRLTHLVGEVQEAVVESAVRHVDVDHLLEKRLQNLAKSDFELLIRGLFEREEIYLIIYGGVLGGIIGGIQLLLVAALT